MCGITNTPVFDFSKAFPQIRFDFTEVDHDRCDSRAHFFINIQIDFCVRVKLTLGVGRTVVKLSFVYGNFFQGEDDAQELVLIVGSAPDHEMVLFNLHDFEILTLWFRDFSFCFSLGQFLPLANAGSFLIVNKDSFKVVITI